MRRPAVTRAAVAAAALDWNAVRTVTTLNALANSSLQKTKIESINFAGAVAAAFRHHVGSRRERSRAKFGGLSGPHQNAVGHGRRDEGHRAGVWPGG